MDFSVCDAKERSLKDYLESNEVKISNCNFKVNLERISLAYRNFNQVPKQLINFLGNNTTILDLSYNNLKSLSFLSSFPKLHTLVLDRNSNLNFASFPVMQNLVILWLNNCNIIITTDWLYNLKSKCCSLKQLSMISNSVGLTTLNGVSDFDEIQYRNKIFEILPNLEYLDGIYNKKNKLKELIEHEQRQKNIQKESIKYYYKFINPNSRKVINLSFLR